MNTISAAQFGEQISILENGDEKYNTAQMWFSVKLDMGQKSEEGRPKVGKWFRISQGLRPGGGWTENFG